MKQKKNDFKKEIKRPSNKKLRPKKYIEVRIPNLPPVPSTQISITKEIPNE